MKKFWILGAIVLGITAIGVLGQRALAQGDAAQSSEAGRYQLTVSGSLNPYVFLLDTKTGRCWLKFQPSDKTWQEITPPKVMSTESSSTQTSSTN